MIAIELLLLAGMAAVFAGTFLASARSHTRAVAWTTPAVIRQATVPQIPVSATNTVIDAERRFAARRALVSADIDIAKAA